MPGSVYVAGPVVAGPFDRMAGLYEAIQSEAENVGMSASLPVRDADLDLLSPEQFVVAVTERIRSAQSVVTILPRNDQSVPVEAALAAALGKRQVLVLDATDAPRMIVGLPGIVGSVRVEDQRVAVEAVRAILQDTGPAGTALM